MFKPRTRNNGVDVRYYKSDKFSAFNQEHQDELQENCNSNENYKGTWSVKVPVSSKYNNGKGNYINIAQVSSILKENDNIKEKESAKKNEIVAAM